MKKLTQREALDILHYATDNKLRHLYGEGYRLGQAIMNYLDVEIHQEVAGTHKDFFHVKDPAKALAMFYEYCVE